MPVGIVNANRNDFILQNGFAVLVDEVVKGWFTECSGLTIERDIKTYAEGGVNDYDHQLPGRIKHTRITLKHGLAGSELWAWFQQGQLDGQVKRQGISIVVYEEGRLVKRWDLPNAYPVKWSGPTLNSTGRDVLLEEVEFASGGSGGGSGSLIQRAATAAPTAEASAPVNLAELANKVYGLLKTDLRLERERLGRKSGFR